MTLPSSVSINKPLEGIDILIYSVPSETVDNDCRKARGGRQASSIIYANCMALPSGWENVAEE